MPHSLRSQLEAYDRTAALDHAATPPSSWYTDPTIAELERTAVFGRSWQLIARLDQLRETGDYVTQDIAGEPIVVVRGDDGALRGFFNVCRHHAAEVATGACGRSHVLRCPYHGWTYGLDGTLRGNPEFREVKNFDKQHNSLTPVALETWEGLVFVKLDGAGPSLREHLGRVVELVEPLKFGMLRFFERRTYDLNCNWKVFVDNYLDGGYHVPHIHKGLGSVIDYGEYKIENIDRSCLQSTPLTSGANADSETSASRRGAMAYYFWIHPNLMLNWYEGYLDTNLVLPLSVGRCRVIFDFYFADGGSDEDAKRRSVAVGERVQQEDIDICESVQRGLRSRSYDIGRLSVRREAGEHLFHRLLAADLLGEIDGCD